MSDSPRDDHLSHISTLWTAVHRAHGSDAEAARLAQDRIIERYMGAAYRYLLRILGDQDAADEVFQEFALRLVRGSFRRADPSRGRFRDYIKTVILRLASDYRAGRCRQGFHADQNALEVADRPESTPESEAAFLESCRAELLDRAWHRLWQIEREQGSPYYSVLRYRTEHPQHNSQEMAKALSESPLTTTPMTAASVRKTLQRARERFALLLVEEVAASLEEDSPERVEQELVELQLKPYCRSALRRLTS